MDLPKALQPCHLCPHLPHIHRLFQLAASSLPSLTPSLINHQGLSAPPLKSPLSLPPPLHYTDLGHTALIISSSLPLCSPLTLAWKFLPYTQCTQLPLPSQNQVTLSISTPSPCSSSLSVTPHTERGGAEKVGEGKGVTTSHRGRNWVWPSSV